MTQLCANIILDPIFAISDELVDACIARLKLSA